MAKSKVKKAKTKKAKAKTAKAKKAGASKATTRSRKASKTKPTGSAAKASKKRATSNGVTKKAAKASRKAPTTSPKAAKAKSAKPKQTAAQKSPAKTPAKTSGKPLPKTVQVIEAVVPPSTVASPAEKKPPARKRGAKKATEPQAVTQPVHEEVHEVTGPVPIAPAQPPSKTNTFYITTAIAYPNGTPHIGHAYEAIATDALARFQRLDGKDVFFLTGTDEHGLKMIQTAQSEGMTPADLATRNAARFKDMDERLNVSFDRFIRTSEPAHHHSVQVIWNRMQQAGDIYIDTYSGWYSVRDEAYYAEEEITIGEDNIRRGPQGTPVEWVEEKSYFFKLSAYQDRLLALYESQPDFIGPDSRRNEVMSFVRGGLRDLSISRTTFDWGVKVPDDLEHVMYVWVDALTNYITGVGFPDEKDAN